MALAPGSRLGPYSILEPVGAGGMGEVYRARDGKLDRYVAIKVLPDSVAADPTALARFEREAKAVAALSHPNILAIHDFETGGETAYAVMELLEGVTLREKLDVGPINKKAALEYALQIARGLSAAHDKGVVHRDLKPENLFVTDDGQVKILDFGLAKRELSVVPAETSAPTAPELTHPGTVMGTVGYMSPEQVRGLPVDQRSDVFSFGAILYELLSGRRAFKKDTAAETMSAILNEDPPELTHSGRTISVALDNVVRHCLEKNRDNRFQSVKDIAFALSEQSSPGVSRGPRFVPQSAARTTFFIAGAAIVCSLVAGILVLRQSHRSSESAGGLKRIAVLPFENIGPPENDLFADGMSDEVRTKLTSLAGVEVVPRASSITYKKVAKPAEQIGRELQADYLLTATIRWQNDGDIRRVHVTPELVELSGSGPPATRWQQSLDGTLTDIFQVQCDIASRTAHALGLTLAAADRKRLSKPPTRDVAAYDAFLRGEDAWTKRVTGSESARRALALFEQAVALDPNFAVAWARVAQANIGLMTLSDPNSGRPERARVGAEKAVASDPGSPEGYLAMGEYQRIVIKDLRAAKQAFAQAERVAPENPDVLLAKASLEGASEAALEDLRHAERVDPRSVLAALSLGQTLCDLRRYGEARAAFDRALAIAPANLWAIEWKMISYLGEGNLRGAQSVLAAAPLQPTELVAGVSTYLGLGFTLDESQRDLLLRLTPSSFDDDRASWGLALAEASYFRKDRVKVRHFAEEARKALEEGLRQAPRDAVMHGNHGIALAYLGMKPEALREGDRALALSREDESTHPFVMGIVVNIYALLDDQAKEVDTLEALLRIPFWISRDWLRIDPTFETLQGNPRFRKLVAGK